MCRECRRLGKDELEYRQVVRNIDNALRGGEFIPRRHRPMVERYLQHPNARVRMHVQQIVATDVQARARARALQEEMLLEKDALAAAWDERVARAPEGPIEDEADSELPW